MHKIWLALIALIVGMGGVERAKAWDGPAHRFGGGANYWVALDDIDEDDIDDDGFSYVVSYQYRPGLLGLELAGELLPDRFGEDAIAPQAHLVLGQALYAAAGVGIVYQDSEFAEDPFYSFRAGFDLEILPNLFLDLNANYRFESSSELEDNATDIDTDTVFAGAQLRIGW